MAGIPFPGEAGKRGREAKTSFMLERVLAGWGLGSAHRVGQLSFVLGSHAAGHTWLSPQDSLLVGLRVPNG